MTLIHGMPCQRMQVLTLFTSARLAYGQRPTLHGAPGVAGGSAVVEMLCCCPICRSVPACGGPAGVS